MKNDDVLPEEVEAHNQPLIEELRRAYQPELQDARALTRIRKRLLAGDGWQTQIETTTWGRRLLVRLSAPGKAYGQKVRWTHSRSLHRTLRGPRPAPGNTNGRSAPSTCS